MLAYFAGPRAGAAVYNVVHTYTRRCRSCSRDFLRPARAHRRGLILIAHIGLDRAFGYGLKYSTAFGDTHLGRSGRR